MREAVDASADFEVDPVVVNVLHEVVFINEVLRDVGELDFDVFGTIQRGAEIEVGDVEGAEACTFAGENTVDHEFDQFKWCRFGADIAWVADAVAANGDAGSVGIGFFGAHFADHLGVGDFFAAVDGYVFVVYDVEGVCAFDSLAISTRVVSNALAETTKFVSIRLVPDGAELGVFAELAIFKGFACIVVYDRGGEVGLGEGC